MSLSFVPIPPRPWSNKPQPTRRELLWIAEGKVCHWCGRATRLVDGDPADQATIDHVVPRYKGGTNNVSNLVSACRECNGRRNSEDMKGLKEGSLLRSNARMSKHICLTADEKKALLARVQATPVKLPSTHSNEDVLREQRDQALRELVPLRNELKLFHKIVEDQEAELKVLRSMTVMGFIRKRIATWLLS